MNRCRIVTCCLVGVLAILSNIPANGGTVLINANINAPAKLVFAVAGSTVSGADMASLGLLVTVHFADGTTSGAVPFVTDTGGCTSAANCGRAGGVAGNGTWTLSQTGDAGAVISASNPNGTAFNPWTLTNTSTNLAISLVELDGGPSLVFDRDNFTGGQAGTPGSNSGIDYTFDNESGANTPYTAAVTYSRIVQVTGAGAGAACVGAFYTGLTTSTGCADAWGRLTFSFSSLSNCATSPQSPGCFVATIGGSAIWRFFQDVDAVSPVTLDVDASITATKYDPFTDGLLIVRYMFGLTGSALTGGALGAFATRTDPAAIKAYLDSIHAELDVDADGKVDALTDGLLIVRYMFGLRDASLTHGVLGNGASRNAGQIQDYLATLMP